MLRDPIVLKTGRVSVALYIVDTLDERFAWEIVVTEKIGAEAVERKVVGPISFSTLAAAEIDGKEAQAEIARGVT